MGNAESRFLFLRYECRSKLLNSFENSNECRFRHHSETLIHVFDNVEGYCLVNIIFLSSVDSYIPKVRLLGFQQK